MSVFCWCCPRTFSFIVTGADCDDDGNGDDDGDDDSDDVLSFFLLWFYDYVMFCFRTRRTSR